MKSTVDAIATMPSSGTLRRIVVVGGGAGGLEHEMSRRDAKRGLASLCIGGGMRVALAAER